MAGQGSEGSDFNPWIKPGVIKLAEIQPNIYTSGADIRYGVRVAAGYGNHIVLFSIPPDSFNDTADSSQSANAPRNSGPAFRTPVAIRGCYIDTAPGLIDLAVHSGPEMTIYAFSSTGFAKVYRLDDGTARTEKFGPRAGVGT